MSKREYIKIRKRNHRKHVMSNICKGIAVLSFCIVAIAIVGTDDYNTEHGYVVKNGTICESGTEVLTNDGTIWDISETSEISNNVKIGNKVKVTINLNGTGNDTSDDTIVSISRRLF